MPSYRDDDKANMNCFMHDNHCVKTQLIITPPTSSNLARGSVK